MTAVPVSGGSTPPRAADGPAPAGAPWPQPVPFLTGDLAPPPPKLERAAGTAREGGACITCGGEAPAGEAECGFCVQARAAQATPTRTLLLHWLVFLAAMAVVFGAGWILTP
ncbi:hypothetical protein [Roseicyclus persicicus]|uniref:Uncharacterized protein n=1 Tax=Roseicyclus persicicus TaxID=2650661 RepID=A0A7X6GZY7_9RHOB|nr:hypothetical protein [Roseibacterium persicicum]NKX45482.1 hypothetical protein [Roseibacterium persicicum]